MVSTPRSFAGKAAGGVARRDKIDVPDRSICAPRRRRRSAARRKPDPVVAPVTSRLVSVLQVALVAALSGALLLFGGWVAVRMAVSGPSDEVPDLIALSVQDAETRLDELGMKAQVDDQRLGDTEMPANHVARQIPRAGTAVKRMRIVRLILAAGPREVHLPSMVGDSYSRAVIALGQQGFDIDYVATAPSYEVAAGTVIAQEPQPAELPLGKMAPLRLLTSLGRPARIYVMAQLRGRRVEVVRPYLAALGFRVSESPNRRVMANVAPGTIVGQQPPPGFKVGHGAEIILQVSR